MSKLTIGELKQGDRIRATRVITEVVEGTVDIRTGTKGEVVAVDWEEPGTPWGSVSRALDESWTVERL